MLVLSEERRKIIVCEKLNKDMARKEEEKKDKRSHLALESDN